MQDPATQAPRPASSAQLLLAHGIDHGLARGRLLRSAGLASVDLDDPHAEVHPRQELGLLAALVDALGDPLALGWTLGRRYHTTTYGIWGFALVSSPTLRAAIEVGSRHLALTYALARIEVALSPTQVRLRLHGDRLPEPVRTAAIARDAAAIAAVRDELLGDRAPFIRVASTAPPPADEQLGARTFGVEVEHEAACDELLLSARTLDDPLPRADARTAALAAAQCAQLLSERRARAGVAGAVRDRLLQDPTRVPPLAQLAAERGVTERTLRRQLAAEGTGFRQLHDEVRELLAHELLLEAGLSVEATARRLGFAEPASFVRAFRRWTGQTPGAYRARLRKSPSGLGIRAVRDPQS